MDIIALAQLIMLAAILAVTIHTNRKWFSRRRFAAREVLPLSNDQLIKPGQSARITVRPQVLSFLIQRLFISRGEDVDGNASDWLVNDIKIGSRSQFAQSGCIPGDMFATNAIDTFVSFEPADRFADIDIVVTYNGKNPEGARFYGAFIGDIEHPRDTRRRHREWNKLRKADLRDRERTPPRPSAN